MNIINKKLVKPIIIVGAPRSGTSLLQSILRGYPGLWSLPSESDMIWDQYCHPSLRGYSSEVMTVEDVNSELKQAIYHDFNKYLCPSSFWSKYLSSGIIWNFNRIQKLRKPLKNVYRYLFPAVQLLWGRVNECTMVEKTASNCFRLEFINEIFNDAIFIYITRDGKNNVNSLINAWLHPSRFFTYNFPEQLNISGYPHKKWKFVLPPGWREYLSRSLEEVCAFQWRSCHEHVLKAINNPRFNGKVYRLKLEDLKENSENVLKEIADFCDLSYKGYLESIGQDMPIVNSPDKIISHEKWKLQNQAKIERILPEIESMMKELGYND